MQIPQPGNLPPMGTGSASVPDHEELIVPKASCTGGFFGLPPLPEKPFLSKERLFCWGRGSPRGSGPGVQQLYVDHTGAAMAAL